jgi:hypothetical protein
VKLGAQQALFPVVPDNAPNGLRQALLDGKVHARAVVDKLGINASMVLNRRREAHGLGLLLGLTCLPRGGGVHDDRL